jgi:hypothetical protein
MKPEFELPTSVIDEVLALQLMVSWAGEDGDDNRRLGWWRCKLTDEMCGADFFGRAVPETAAWTALDAVRRAAILVDRGGRLRHGNPDRLRTLFFFGFAVDEQLKFRLAGLKRSGSPIRDVLQMPEGFMQTFDRTSFRTFLGTLHVGGDMTVTPTGRQLKGAPPTAPEVAAARLAAALAPLNETYPMPYFLMPT